jgi:hypothetical protein
MRTEKEKLDEFRERAGSEPLAHAMVRVRRETIAEVKEELEKVAKSHDELATKYPKGPDATKALALRRFADVFL